MNTIEKPISVRTLTFIAAATFLCYEMILQVALALITKPLMSSAGINALHLGWLSSCYFLSYTVMQIPAGLLFDRFSCRSVMLYSALCCAIGALIFAYFTNSIIAIYLARFLIGAGSAFPFVGLLVVSANCFKAEYFSMFVGITQILAALGGLLGSAPLAKLITSIGWLLSLRYTAFLGLACVVAIYFGLSILDKNQNAIDAKRNILTDVKTITQKKETWIVAAYAFCNWGPMIFLATMWGEPFLVEKLNIATEHAAAIIQFLWIGLSIGSFTIGAIAKTHKMQKNIMSITALLGTLVSLSFIYLNFSVNIYYALTTLIGIASAGQILSFSMVKKINSDSLVGTAVGFNNMCVVAGGFLLQPIIGAILDKMWDGKIIDGAPFYNIHAYKVSLMIIPVCYAVSFLVSFFLREKNAA